MRSVRPRRAISGMGHVGRRLMRCVARRRPCRRRRSWWCHTPLIDSGYPHACEAGGVQMRLLQARLDMGPHGVPRGCQLSSQSCNGGSLEAQLSDRPADRPHTHTRPGSTHPRVMFQECHRLAGAFATHPAPYCATGTAPEPRPKARRSPPPRARDLERSPPTRAASIAVTGVYVEHQSALRPSGSS